MGQRVGRCYADKLRGGDDEGDDDDDDDDDDEDDGDDDDGDDVKYRYVVYCVDMI